MKANIIKNEAKELRLEFDTNDLTILDLIANNLMEQKEVVFAGVTKEHPEIGRPVLVLKTENKKPIEILNKTLDKIKESFEELKEDVEKIK